MSSEDSPTRILLVIDVQRCLIDPPHPVPGSRKILRNLEVVLARERAGSPPTKGMSHFKLTISNLRQSSWRTTLKQLHGL
jgi:nicotinamidase-related amidase